MQLAVLRLCPDAPQQLREVLRTTTIKHIKPEHKCHCVSKNYGEKKAGQETASKGLGLLTF